MVGIGSSRTLVMAATLLCAAAASCGAPDLTYRQESGAASDASPDAPPDVSFDVSPDSDSATDSSPPEAGFDASADAAADSSTDALADSAADAVDDVPGDTEPDTLSDALDDPSLDSPADVGVDAPVCPAGMADVPRANLSVYCVDATEVRAGDYALWLATSPATLGQVPGCETNTDFTPAGSENGCSAATYDPVARPDDPVVCVDWCDATAYCASHGKRLCGDINGGPVAPNKFKNASADQWYRACSQGSTKPFPYGNTFVAASCNGAGYGADSLIAVQSAASCIGGYPGLYDMSGNAREWQDACDGAASDSSCRVRGGGYTDGMTALRCDADLAIPRLTRAANVGFRCCGQ